MDINTLKEKSDLAHSIAVDKQNALEKIKSRQILVYNHHLFRANAETINLVAVLSQRVNGTVYVMDTNNNPCAITHPAEFLEKLIERNQETVNRYHQIYSQFKTRAKK